LDYGAIAVAPVSMPFVTEPVSTVSPVSVPVKTFSEISETLPGLLPSEPFVSVPDGSLPEASPELVHPHAASAEPHDTTAVPVFTAAPKATGMATQRLCVIENEHELAPPVHVPPAVTVGVPQHTVVAFPVFAYGVTVTGTQTVSF
jgi:hypothetical protein